MLTVRSAEHGGRLRKYYRITDEGRTRLDEFIAEWEEVMLIYRFVTKGEEKNDQTGISREAE